MEKGQPLQAMPPRISRRYPPPQSPDRWLLVALIGVFVLALPVLRYPIGHDQATYSTIAEGLLKGKQLYRDLWDNKPPGIFYIYAPIVMLFGRVMWFVGVLDFLYLVVISFFIYRFTKEFLGGPAGAIAALIYALWHERGGSLNAGQPEAFILLLIFAAYFVIKAQGENLGLRQFIAGAILGLAFWTKYNAGIFLVFLAVLPYLDFSRLDQSPRRLGFTIPWRPWLRQVAILTGGFAAVVGLGVAYFKFADAWGAMKEVQFEVLPRYAAMAVSHTPHYFLWGLDQIYLNLTPAVEAAAAAALAIAWWKQELQKLAPVLLAACAGLIAVVSQVRMHAYYFDICLPFFAMVCAYLPVKLYEGVRALSLECARRRMTLARGLLWIAFANLLYLPLPAPASLWIQHFKGLVIWVHDPQRSYSTYSWPDPTEEMRDQTKVITYIRGHSKMSDKIFVWGNAPLIYFLSDREPASRFISNLGVMSAWSPPQWRAELVQTLHQSQPLFLVVARMDALHWITYTPLDSQQYLVQYPALAKLLARNYTPVMTLQHFVVYRRSNRFGTRTGS